MRGHDRADSGTALKPRPADLEDAEAVADIFVRTARTAFAETIPASWLARLSIEAETKTYAQWIESGDFTIFLAEAEAGPVGFAVSGPNMSGPDPLAARQYPGELAGIFMRSSGQRQGWGRALVRAVAEDMRARERNGMVVCTHRDNIAARRFYESLGAVAFDEIVVDFDGVGVVEIAYGWSDLSQLAELR